MTMIKTETFLLSTRTQPKISSSLCVVCDDWQPYLSALSKSIATLICSRCDLLSINLFR